MQLLIAITAAIASLGVLSAWIAENVLINRIAIVGPYVGFELSHNPGIAFGVRLPSLFQEVVIIAALIAVTIVAVRSVRTRQGYTAPFGLILGGGIANVIDRLPDGLVTDFIQIMSFPLFNIPDSCITVGVICLLWEGWKGEM